jgi:hypothetical protein
MKILGKPSQIRWICSGFLAVILILPLGGAAYAADGGSDSAVNFVTGNLWLLIATAIVFLMHLDFATQRAGLTKGKYSQYPLQECLHSRPYLSSIS